MIDTNTPYLETERLILRKFTDNDIEALYLLLKDKEVNAFLPWFPLKTIDETVIFFEERFAANYKKPCAYNYAICLKSDNYPIGYVNVNMDDSHDFGYGLRKEFWHKGIVTEAGRAVVEQLKKDSIPYITATHDVNNPRSGGVMKQLGMKYRYSYEERVQPKDVLVTFRMYQLNLDGLKERVYQKYWDDSDVHFIETDI
jgi:ribosomal-protein-alanine N-acetyltransferase